MRRAAIAVVVAVLAAGSAAPAVADDRPAAPRQVSDVEVRRDFTYKTVDGDELKLDAHIPSGGGVRPGVMVIYGAGG
jgi:hypothetical protein